MHFKIDPNATKVRLTVKAEYASLQAQYVQTGDRDAFRKMIDCIEASIDDTTGKVSFGRRCLDLLGKVGHWMFVGLEIEGFAMYPWLAAEAAEAKAEALGENPSEPIYSPLLGWHDPNTKQPANPPQKGSERSYPCVMEIRAGQRSETMAQAMAHNISTVERDAEMLKAVLEARNDNDHLGELQVAQSHLLAAYEACLHLFAEEVAAAHDTMDEPVGSERVSDPHDVEIALTAASRAERYETR